MARRQFVVDRSLARFEGHLLLQGFGVAQHFRAQRAIAPDRFHRVCIQRLARLGDDPVAAGGNISNREGAVGGNPSFEKPQNVFDVLALNRTR
jgi:hypothetical protein